MYQHKLIRVCICRDIVCVIVFDLKVIDGYGVSSSFIRSALKASNYYWAVWACTPAFSQEFAQQCFEVHKQHNHSCKHMNRQWLNRLRNMQCWLTEKVKNIAEFQMFRTSYMHTVLLTHFLRVCIWRQHLLRGMQGNPKHFHASQGNNYRQNLRFRRKSHHPGAAFLIICQKAPVTLPRDRNCR